MKWKIRTIPVIFFNQLPFVMALCCSSTPPQRFEQHFDGLVALHGPVSATRCRNDCEEAFHFSFFFLWAESMIETGYACHQNALAIASSFSKKLGGLENRTTRADKCHE
jgi:hypothetical protein